MSNLIANGWLNEGVGKGHAPRGSLIGISQAIRAQLENSQESIQSEETRAPAYLENELEGRLRSDATREVREDAAPAGRDVFDMTRDGLQARICFGACGQTHLTHKTHVDIEVIHGDKGEMRNAVLLHSSASASFDDVCLKIVNSVAGNNIETSELAPVPLVSVWRFERSVLHFSAVERFLDPAFQGSADAQVVTSVNLLSAKYASSQ